MTREEFITILTPYLVSMRVDFDLPTFSAYYRVLKGVPATLFSAVVDRVMGEDRKYVPRAGEFKVLCELERKTIIAANPFRHCEQCDSMGWRSLPDRKAERCPCFTAHWARLEQLGAPAKPLALPPASTHMEGLQAIGERYGDE